MMAEYILDTTEGIYNARTTGEIVRCRDCSYCDEAEMRDGHECWRDPDHTWHATPTQLDGFCSWAAPREEADDGE